jgi:hypothetical protein
MYILGAFISSGFFCLLGLLMFLEIPVSNKDLLYLSIGALLAAFSTVVGYFFGSSKSSADKNDLMMKGPTPPA